MVRPTTDHKPAIQEIKRLHDELTGKTALQKAQRIGQLLDQVKRGIAHGKWLPWLEKHCNFSRQTAKNYMAVWEYRDELKSQSVCDLTAAYAYVKSVNGMEKRDSSEDDSYQLPIDPNSREELEDLITWHARTDPDLKQGDVVIHALRRLQGNRDGKEDTFGQRVIRKLGEERFRQLCERETRCDSDQW